MIAQVGGVPKTLAAPHITNPNMADIKQNDQTEKTDLSIAN